MEHIRLLAISGSLRAESANSLLLRAVGNLLPTGTTYVISEMPGALPHFNSDLDHPPVITAVAAFRAELSASTHVVVCSPEYAAGIPGTLKNALDWVVGSGEFVDKPVLLLNSSSTGGERAQDSLAATLAIMNAKVVRGPRFFVANAKSAVDRDGNFVSGEVERSVHAAVSDFLGTRLPFP